MLLVMGLVLPAATTLSARADQPKYDSLASLLEPLRSEADLPALAAAVVVGGRIKALGVVGVRKYGSDLPPR